MTTADERTIGRLLRRMDGLLGEMETDHSPLRVFLATYTRTTRAVAEALQDGRFEDPAWVEEWDVVFADLYLDALEAYRRDPASAPRPWRIAFGADSRLPAETRLLLGMNAHINYDLPQALIAVIPPEDVQNGRLMDRRRRDHERIDDILASRVAAEDVELAKAGGRRTLVDRAAAPLNHLATKRFLKEARLKVWHNTLALHEARLQGEQAYADRLRELDVLSSARVNDLLRPGPVIVRLGFAGFGVTLPPSLSASPAP
jgi:Family of unknown function (DUF5995)